MPNIDIYTQPGCPFCQKALALLKSKNLKFNEINAPKGSNEREEAIKKSGGKATVPQIFIDNKPIGGCDDLLKLDASGKLDKILHP